MSGSVVDCIVIGGGPSGATASSELCREGYSVILLDPKKEPGIPVLCGEGISKNTLELSGLDPDGPWIVNPVSGYRLRSPSGDDLFSATEGFNIKRDLFDKELCKIAEGNGVELRFGIAVSTIEEEDHIWKINTPKGLLRSRSIVVACGVNQHILPQVAPDNIPLTIKALGAKINKKEQGGELLFYVKEALKGGYGWYFPRNDEINIGVLSPGDISNEFKWLLKTTGIKRNEIRSFHGGEIPISGPMKTYRNDNCIIVGDAGGFSNPVSKGGIVGALLSGKEGAKALAGSLSGEEDRLKEWSKKMREHPAFSHLNLERLEFLTSLDDNTLNSLTDIAGGRDIWSIPKTEVLKGTWKRPELLRAIRGALHIARGGREWARWAF